MTRRIVLGAAAAVAAHPDWTYVPRQEPPYDGEMGNLVRAEQTGAEAIVQVMAVIG